MKEKFQKQVAAFVKANRMETDVSHRVLDLVSEVGEVAKEVLKSTKYGKAEFKPGPNWRSELGDVMFALPCVANSTGVDLEQALNEALDKYRRRIDETQHVGSGR